MDQIIVAGIHKKSFELFYNGGTLWAEHLDGMGTYSPLVIEKFKKDYEVFSRPSCSSFLIINLDKTEITEEIATCIVETIINSAKRFKKIAFVGVKRKWKSRFYQIQTEKGAIIAFINDFEKAKQWVLP